MKSPQHFELPNSHLVTNTYAPEETMYHQEILVSRARFIQSNEGICVLEEHQPHHGKLGGDEVPLSTKYEGNNQHLQFKRFRRHRSDQNPKAANQLPYKPNEALAPDEYRRSSEPAVGPRPELFSDGINEGNNERHASSAGSTFLTSVSQVARRSNAKPSASSDPLGLTLVHDSDRPVADLIFIHGLGGSAIGTWSYNRDTENFWLPWLGSEVGLSDLRIFTFGYNAHFAQRSTTLTILDFAKDMLFQLKTYCHEKDDDDKLIGKRPIIFVAHSMGGLVVKKAYIIGNSDDHYLNIVSQIYGIVFLATPHRGSGLAQMLNTILRAAPNTGSKVYVGELEKSSTTLQDINEQFRTACGDLVLVSFHETLKTALGPGVNAIIVAKESAILGYPTETSAPLQADHHGIAKFSSPDDTNYRDVRNVLRMFVREIKERRNPERQSTHSVSITSLEDVLGIVKYTNDYLDIYRERIVPGTCQWILHKKSFQDWAEGNDEAAAIFWLTGLPATGKSTLSSFIIGYLNQGFVPGSCQYHFIKAEHHSTRTVSYLLCSIAFQIAQKHQVFRTKLLEMYQESGILFGQQKLNVIWERIFEGILFRLNLEGPLFWVIDGLDEAKPPYSLIPLITKIRSATRIRVLLVSRHTKELSTTLRLDSCPIHHEDLSTNDTADDIRSYVSTVIRQTVPDNQEQEIVINNVLAKASGSFLWVKLALERLKENWHTQENIQRALTDIPGGMELMYQRMIEIIATEPPVTSRIAVEILTWTACSFQPLDIKELEVALKPEFGSFLNLGATIVQICGNFITIEKSKVALIHETARQFLLTKTTHLPILIDSRLGHERIAVACMNFLSDPKWRTRFASAQEAGSARFNKLESRDVITEVPFFWYATNHWAYHVNCASADSDSLQTTLLDFMERFSLLWINAVALCKNLRIITRSAQYLKAYAKRIAYRSSKSPPTSFKASREEELQQWATDLIRVVGRFGPYLAESPSSIHKHVIPFCPKDSIIGRNFRHLGGNSISVSGISSGAWDDCLARLTMGGDETASKIICKDKFFINLLGGSGTLVIWHAETCEEERRLHHGGEWVTVITSSKTSNLVASGGIKTIRVWDITNGEELYNIPKTNQGRLMSLAFSSKDDKLLIAYDDCSIQCIDLEASLERWCFRAEDLLDSEHSCPRLMAFSPDAKKIAVAYRGRPVFLWTISHQRQPPQRCIRKDDIYKMDGDVWNAPEAVLWQPESANVLILYQDTTLVDWNIEDDTQTEHAHLSAREMAVSPDGTLLLTSDHNGTLSVWTTGQFRLTYQVKYDGFVRDLAFAPDCQRFYDIRETLCNVWEPDALIRSDNTTGEDASSTHETLFSEPILSADDNDRVQISALISGKEDKFYCCGNENGSVMMYDLVTARKVRKLYGHASTVAVIELSWSTSQKYIASADDSGRVIAKRLEKPSPQAPKKWAVFPLLDIRIGTTVKQILFSSSEEYLLISCATIDQVWSLKSKKQVFHIKHSVGNNRRWIQHPTDSTLLISIDQNEQYIYKWTTLKRVPYAGAAEEEESCKGSEGATHTAISNLKTTGLSRDAAAAPQDTKSSNSSLDAFERIVQVRNRYIILESHPSRSKSSGVLPTPSRQLEIIDITGLQQNTKFNRRSLPGLSQHVNRLIGDFQGRVVFLDHQFWLCTWEISDDESEYKRHFFLPKDWLSPDALKLAVCSHYGTLLCPRNGEVGIVRSGIRL